MTPEEAREVRKVAAALRPFSRAIDQALRRAHRKSVKVVSILQENRDGE